MHLAAMQATFQVNIDAPGSFDTLLCDGAQGLFWYLLKWPQYILELPPINFRLNKGLIVIFWCEHHATSRLAQRLISHLYIDFS